MKLFFRYLYDNGCQDPNEKKYFYLNDELRRAIDDPQYTGKVTTPDIMRIIHSGKVLLSK
jgi:hypothetical protein